MEKEPSSQTRGEYDTKVGAPERSYKTPHTKMRRRIMKRRHNGYERMKGQMKPT